MLKQCSSNRLWLAREMCYAKTIANSMRKVIRSSVIVTVAYSKIVNGTGNLHVSGILVSVFDLVSNVDEESFESSVKLTTVLNHSPGFYSLFLKCQIPKYHLDHVR